MSPITKYKTAMAIIFISYSSKDKDIARKISSDLKALGHTPWLDEWEIKVGDCIQTKIDDGLDKCDYLILLLSDDSVNSGWVDKEWKSVYSKEIKSRRTYVLPVLLSNCEIPRILETKKYADFRANYTLGMIDVIDSIKSKNYKSKERKDQRKEEIIWHHNIHLHMAQERLCYCVLTFEPIYSKISIYDSLKQLFGEIKVNSYAIYELTGGVDIILRLWLPASISNEEFEGLLVDGVKKETRSSVQRFEWFVVDCVISHWIFKNNRINIEQARAMLKDQLVVDSLYKSSDQYEKYHKHDIVSKTEVYDGVTFLIFVTQPYGNHSIDAIRAFKDAIKKIIDNQDGIKNISFYGGMDGRFRYLIKGCVDYQDFPLINSELIAKINSEAIQNYFSVRTFTYTSIDSDVVEQLILPFSEQVNEHEKSLESLLLNNESENFEVKGYMFADIDSWAGKTKGAPLEKNKILEIGALKSIIGFLNSGIEATIVIGAVENDKYEDCDKILRLPLMGRYRIIGLEELEYAGRDWDAFQNKMLQAILFNIDPVPNALISTKLVTLDCGEIKKDLCVISVYKQNGLWFYYKNKHEFYVRDGNRTIPLSARQADEFKAAVRLKNQK